MDRIDRRTFLATGLKTGAALAVVGGAAGAVVEAAAPATASACGNGSDRVRRAPDHLTAVGVTDPVGVDPDDVQFAWHVVDPRRGAVQSGYRIVVTGPDGSASTVWDSGRGGVGPAGVRRLRRPSTVGRRPVPVDGEDGGRPGRWSEPSAPASFTTGLRTGDWTAPLAATRPRRPRRRRSTPTSAPPRPLPRGTIARATAYVAAAHKYQLWVNGAQVDSGPELLLPRRAVLPGHRHHVGAGRRAPQRGRRPPPLVRAGPGPPRPRRPASSSRWRSTTPTAPG